MTTSNESKQVIHKGVAYTAKGAADPCLNGTYENSAFSTNLGAGASTKTQIEGNPIALVGTHWDPSLSAGVVGVKSATTMKEAVVVRGSKDLLIEGRPAARNLDPTTQNHQNSAGLVFPGMLQPSAESNEERAKKRCKLTEWKATSGDGGKLGYPGLNKTGKPSYLEVKRDDTVSFTSQRHDITKTPHEPNPKCEFAPHTKWLAKGNKFPLFTSPGEKKAEGTESFEIPASLVVEAFASAEVMKAVGEGDVGKAMNELTSQLLTSKAPKEELGGSLGKVGVSGKGPTIDVKVEKSLGSKDGPAKVVVDVRTLLFFFWWWISAPEVKVTAESCGGALDATLKVFPKESLEFEFKWDAALKEGHRGKRYAGAEKKLEDKLEAMEKLRDKSADKAASAARRGAAAAEKGATSVLKAEGVEGNSPQAQQRRNANMNRADEAFDEAKKQYAKAEAALAKFEYAERTIDSVKDALKNLEKSLSTLKRLSDLADVPIKYEIAKGLSIKIGLEYARCEDKKSARGWREYTSAQLGQVWSLTLGCETLIGVSWSARMSLLEFAGPYMRYVAQLLRKYRIFNIDLGIALSFEVGASVTLQKKQHDEFSGKGEANAKFTPGLFIELGGASVDYVTAKVEFPSELKAEFEPPEEKGALLKVTPKFSTANWYSVVLFPDRWWKVKVAAGEIVELTGKWNRDGSFYWAVPTVPA